jgi:hypothetical protein
MATKSNIGQSLTNDNVGIGVVPVDGANVLQVEGNATVNGNLGIGTTSPNAKLKISSFGGNADLIIKAEYSNDSAILSLAGTGGNNQWDLKADNIDSLTLKSNNNGAIILGALQNGNVGIGTTTPQAKLDVITNNGGLKVGSVGNYGVFEWDNNTAIVKIGSKGGQNWPISFEQNDLVIMRINSAGNVGIGTKTPTEKLHVVGNALVTGIAKYESDLSSTFTERTLVDQGYVSRQINVIESLTLDETFNNAIVKIKSNCSIIVPSGLPKNFNCVFDVWQDSSVNLDFSQVLLNDDIGKLVVAGKMATLYQDGDTDIYRLRGEVS